MLSPNLVALNVEFHYRMNLPHSVVQHVLSTVALIFRSMAYIPERFADHCNDSEIDRGQLLRSASVKRKPCGSPTKNGCANLTPLRFCGYLNHNGAWFISSHILQGDVKVAVPLCSQINYATPKSIPFLFRPDAF